MKRKYKNTYFREDFSGQDLSGKDLSSTEFVACNFTKADLSNADCSNCDFTASILKDTKCTNTNFSHSCLACMFHPSDCFGMTLTLDCRTFSRMNISLKWWFSFLYFAMQMVPEKEKGIDLRDKLKQEVIGSQRFERLQTLFKNRQL